MPHHSTTTRPSPDELVPDSPEPREHSNNKLIALALAGALSLAACGGSGDEAIDDPDADTSATIAATADDEDRAGGDLTIGGDDSSVRVDFNGIPDDFPDAVVLPEGYVASQVQRQELGGKVGFTAVGTAADDTKTVFDEMQTAYDQEPSGTLVNGDVHNVTFEDVDGYEISYTMEDNRDGVAVVTIGVFPDIG